MREGRWREENAEGERQTNRERDENDCDSRARRAAEGAGAGSSEGCRSPEREGDQCPLGGQCQPEAVGGDEGWWVRDRSIHRPCRHRDRPQSCSGGEQTMSRRDETVELSLQVHHETAGAYLVS